MHPTPAVFLPHSQPWLSPAFPPNPGSQNKHGLPQHPLTRSPRAHLPGSQPGNRDSDAKDSLRVCADSGPGPARRRASTDNTHLCGGGFPGLKPAILPAFFFFFLMYPVLLARPRQGEKGPSWHTFCIRKRRYFMRSPASADYVSPPHRESRLKPAFRSRSPLAKQTAGHLTLFLSP